MSMRRRRSFMPKAGSNLPTARSLPWSAPVTALPSGRDIVEALAPILGRPVEPSGPELSAPEKGEPPEPPKASGGDHRRAWSDFCRHRRSRPRHRHAVRKVHIVLLKFDLALKLQRNTGNNLCH